MNLKQQFSDQRTRRRRSWQSLILFLIAIACASICSGQSVSIAEKLPDGSYVVLIDGVEFRAITGDKAVELAKQKVELAACRDEQAKLTTAYDLAKKDVTIAQQETKIEHGNFVRVMQLYEKEWELRTE